MKITILLLLVAALLSIGPSQTAQALNPPPDGGYTGGNTAEGRNALLSLTSCIYNTAIGLFSLTTNTGASSTPLLALGRFFPTLRTKIPPLVPGRF